MAFSLWQSDSRAPFLGRLGRFILGRVGLRDRLTLTPAACILGVVAGILALICHTSNGLQTLELRLYDQMTRWQTLSQPDDRFLLVTITEADLQTQGRWPIADGVLAQALHTLQQYQPKVIGLDLYRDLPIAPGTPALAEEFQAPNLITIWKLPDWGMAPVLPPPGVSLQHIAFNDFVLDRDGIMRRGFLYAAPTALDTLPPNPESPFADSPQGFYSLGLRLALAQGDWQVEDLQITPDGLRLGSVSIPRLQPWAGGYGQENTNGYQMLLDYRVDPQFPHVSLSQVLAGDITPEQVRDRIILVGTVAPSLKDGVLTPLSASRVTNPYRPGVLLHAQLTQQLMNLFNSDRPVAPLQPAPFQGFRFWSPLGEGLWIIFWGMAGGWLMARQPHILRGGLGGVLMGLCLAVLSLVAFQQSLWLPLVAPWVSLGLALIITSLYRTLYLTFYDSLTGLPNRVQFLHTLEQRLNRPPTAEPHPSGLAVLFVALNRLGLLNTSFGYAVGDRLLLMVRDLIQAQLPQSSTLARISGDEFALVLPCDPQDPQPILALAEHLNQTLETSITLPGHPQPFALSATIGITFTQTDGTAQADNLLRNAHSAMYRAKSLGRSYYEVFAIGSYEQLRRRLGLEVNLRQALDRQELQVYYQPIIHLASGRLAGFEALVRWWHPEQGFMYPAEFVEIAEETGLIIPLDQWVLEEACRQVQEWNTDLCRDRPLLLNVNLSPEQFGKSNFIESISQILQRTGFPGQNLKLEITERVAMADVEHNIDVMLQLKDLELQLSLDDFGTGYSSLNYLCRFPVDTLKIDQSFVRRLTNSESDRAIIQTIITLGHALGMSVTAEGIETLEQQHQLCQWQCEYGQGYIFSHPLTAPEAQQWIHQSQSQLL